MTTIPKDALEALDQLVEAAKAAVDLEYPEHAANERKRKRDFDFIAQAAETINAHLTRLSKLEPIIKEQNDALKALLSAVKESGTMEDRKYVFFGIWVNEVIRNGENTLAANKTITPNQGQQSHDQ